MTLRGEYATVSDLRATYLAATQTTDDALLLDIIRATSRDMDDLCVPKRFYPRIETRYFDMPWDRELGFDDWLLELTTLTNGDATVITSTDYQIQPRNFGPYHALRLKDMSSVVWLWDTNGNAEDAITLAGVWGYHADYANAWEDIGTVTAEALDTTETGVDVVAGTAASAGQLLKIDSEYLYVVSIATNTLTVLRGVNGSTAANHLTAAPITRWTVAQNLSLLCKQAAAASYKLRANPTGETITIDGHTFNTPRDVRPWLAKQLGLLGLMPTH